MIARRDGFAVLTGEIGTGKTTIARALLTRLDRTAFASLILNPFLSIEELVREVLLDFGVVSKDDVRSGRAAAASRDDLVRTLARLPVVDCRHRRARRPDPGRSAAPAGRCPRPVAPHRQRGQRQRRAARCSSCSWACPRWLDALGEPDLQPFDSRVSCQLRLTPLSRPDLDGYVAHRLHVARSSTAVYFNTEAMDLLHALSRGVPRSVNLLCDRALMLCARERVHEVGPDAIRRAGRGPGHDGRRADVLPRRRVASDGSRPRWPWLAAVAGVLAFAAVADWVNAPLPDLPGAPHVAQAPPAEPYPVPPTLELNPRAGARAAALTHFSRLLAAASGQRLVGDLGQALVLQARAHVLPRRQVPQLVLQAVIALHA